MDGKRDRKGAVFDKRKSYMNYKKNEDKIPEDFKKRISSTRIEELEKDRIAEESPYKTYDIPKPPRFSGDVKSYKTKSSIPKLFFNERGHVIQSFDKFETIDQESSLVNLETYFSKYDQSEAANITFKDIFTFDIDEYEIVRNKIEEFKNVGILLNDEELTSFFNEKLNEIMENKEKVEIASLNIDKVEEIVLLNETLKVFFKKIKK